jgi:hypothetical protein
MFQRLPKVTLCQVRARQQVWQQVGLEMLSRLMPSVAVKNWRKQEYQATATSYTSSGSTVKCPLLNVMRVRSYTSRGGRQKWGEIMSAILQVRCLWGNRHQLNVTWGKEEVG